MSHFIFQVGLQFTYSGVRLRYTLGHNLLVTFFVTSISTVLALIAHRIEKEIATESTEHDLIELSRKELVAIHLVNITLALAKGRLTSQTAWSVKRPLSDVLFD